VSAVDGPPKPLRKPTRGGFFCDTSSSAEVSGASPCSSMSCAGLDGGRLGEAAVDGGHVLQRHHAVALRALHDHDVVAREVELVRQGLGLEAIRVRAQAAAP
jgi:hypothetical protein